MVSLSPGKVLLNAKENFDTLSVPSCSCLLASQQ